MDLYSEIHACEREKTENGNCRTFKLELQSTMDKVSNTKNGEDEEATKGDIGIWKAEMKNNESSNGKCYESRDKGIESRDGKHDESRERGIESGDGKNYESSESRTNRNPQTPRDNLGP